MSIDSSRISDWPHTMMGLVDRVLSDDVLRYCHSTLEPVQGNPGTCLFPFKHIGLMGCSGF